MEDAMFGRQLYWSLTIITLFLLVDVGQAADRITLAETNWDQYAPRGKEVDCIYGDTVLRNDKIVIVIAKPISTRNANMTVRRVGGAIIDMTEVSSPNDQLSAYYPAGGLLDFDESQQLESISGKAEVSYTLTSRARENQARVELTYRLRDGEPYLWLETVWSNPHENPVVLELVDGIRADHSFISRIDETRNLFLTHDYWWRQAYGSIAEDHTVQRVEDVERGRMMVLRYSTDKQPPTLANGETYRLVRRVFPGKDALSVIAVADQILGESTVGTIVRVRDANGGVARAKVTVQQKDGEQSTGQTDDRGELTLRLRKGVYSLNVQALGRPAVDVALDLIANDSSGSVDISLELPGYITGNISDNDGKPLACKVELQGINNTESPNFGPDSGIYGVRNVVYTPDGVFRREIAPGQYRVIVSHGPEFDAVVKTVEVRRGEQTTLNEVLARSVDSTGWISSDFHSHASPSGDNTASQLGRVLNLLCEHIEFAPCTEHNRISTYVPHLKKLKALDRMATCSGIELTGSPLPVNHQNAFPLKHYPRRQDGGGPQTDDNPVVQIERLAMWDEQSEKLVQENHPHLIQILGDRDLDRTADGGFEKMFGFMDAIEVHPPYTILSTPTAAPAPRERPNVIFNWMQLLNLGYRITGVVNTDAHYNFHGSGWLRNYIKCSTDDVTKISVSEIVTASENGNLVMTNGPFMEVAMSTEGSESKLPGEDLSCTNGKGELRVRVQCANWLDINRVQVMVNGRPAEAMNFVRRTKPEFFGNGVVKFDQKIKFELKEDAHIIVVAIGEGLTLGPVVGPTHAEEPPAAVSNPIFVDVDGNGFQPNGDQLDYPLPIANN